MPKGGFQTITKSLNHFEVNPITGCWLWTRCRSKAGYGKITIGNRTILVHRVIACIFFGIEYDDPRLVCHSCNVRNCINPVHLYLGDASSNQQDAVKAGTHRLFGKTRAYLAVGGK